MTRSEARSRKSTSLLDIRVAMVAVIGFCVFLNVYPTQALLPYFRRIFTASQFHVSLTVSATTIAIALAAPIVGIIGEHLGRRQTMVASLALLTIPVLLSATAPGLNVLIGWRFAQGLLMPGIIAVTIAYISEEWSAGAATVMSAYVAGNVFGGVCGRFVSGVLADHFGWRCTFVVLALLNGAGAIAVWRWLPKSRHPHVPPRLGATLESMAGHFRRPQILATFIVGTGTLFALVATFTYVTFYLAAPEFHLGTSALGSLFAVYLVGVVVTPLGGPWIDRLGHRTAYVVSAVASAVGIAMTASNRLPMVVAGLAICSSGVFICQSAAASYLGHAAGRARSSAAGLYASFYYAGGTLGASVPALAWKAGGWHACVALSIAVLMAAAGVVSFFWKPADHHPAIGVEMG